MLASVTAPTAMPISVPMRVSSSIFIANKWMGGVFIVTRQYFHVRREGMANDIEFWVAGEPVPQGSTKSFYLKKVKKVVTTHQGGRDLQQWRQRIANEAQRANEKQGESFYQDDRNLAYGVNIDLVSTLPKSYPKRRVVAYTKRPDLDKFVRAVLDAITGVLIPDDSQVTSVTATKSFAGSQYPHPAPGCNIEVVKLPIRGY